MDQYTVSMGSLHTVCIHQFERSVPGRFAQNISHQMRFTIATLRFTVSIDILWRRVPRTLYHATGWRPLQVFKLSSNTDMERDKKLLVAPMSSILPSLLWCLQNNRHWSCDMEAGEQDPNAQYPGSN